MPYSYYRETPITIRVNKGQPKIITMKQLFDIYEDQKVVLSDREYVDLTNVGKYIGYENIPIKHKSIRRNYLDSKNTSNVKIFEKHFIEVLDGDGNWTELQQILRHKRDVNMVAYQLNSGDYSIVTTNHPVILEDGTEVKAEDLKEGMKVKVGDIDAFNNLATEYIDVPEEFAYFIGFILGDGNVGRHRFNSKNYNLLDTDLCINVTAFDGGITIYQKNIKNTKIYNCVKAVVNDMDDLCRKSVNMRDGDRISFNNRTIRMLLSKYFGLDYGNSSRTKNIPLNILSWTRNTKLSFIAGLIDAEGSVGQNGKVDIRMTAMGIMASLQEVLKSIGIESIKRICGNTFECLYGISFDGTNELQKYSVKLSNVEIKEINHNYDTLNRDNTIKKIDIFNPDTDIKLAYNLEEEDSEFYYVYDITTASHTFYSNGMTQHNCWAASLAPIINEGMPWVKNIRVKPVKHFDTLISNSIKYIYNLSTQCVGAIAVPDLLAYAEYFIRKDYGEEWYNNEDSVRHVKQGFQQWIYGVNDKARGNQSPFTNVSIFDKYWRKAMFEKHTNPDFSTCDLENLKRTQRLFIDVMLEEQESNPFTFPVLTACQLKDSETGEIMDKDWLNWLAEKLVQNKLVNIYTSSSVDSLSSCCVKGNQLIRVINEKTGKEELMTIKTFINLFVDENETIDKKLKTGYKIKSYNYLTNSWEDDEIIGVLKKVHDKLNMIKFIVNGNEIIVTHDHILTVKEITSGKIKELTAKEVFDNYNLYEIGVEE